MAKQGLFSVILYFINKTIRVVSSIKLLNATREEPMQFQSSVY